MCAGVKVTTTDWVMVLTTMSEDPVVSQRCKAKRSSQLHVDHCIALLYLTQVNYYVAFLCCYNNIIIIQHLYSALKSCKGYGGALNLRSMFVLTVGWSHC